MAVAVKPSPPVRANANPGAEARFEGLVLDFLSYLELERGLSRNTLHAYRTDLFQYGEYLSAHGLDALKARPADIGEFLADLATGNGRPACSASTIHRKAACLRSFYKHLRRDELIADDPTAALSAPRRAKKLPQVLNYSEVGSCCSPPRAASEPTTLRDRALLEMMYACGLRASETIGLEVGDIDLREGFLRARGKGSKERLVPLGRQAIAAISVYMRSGRPKLVGERHEPKLFVNFRGGPLTRQGLYKIVQRHARAAGLSRPDEPPHAAPQLRHPPARRWLRPARRAGDARPRRHLDHPDVHAPLRRAAQGRLLPQLTHAPRTTARIEPGDARAARGRDRLSTARARAVGAEDRAPRGARRALVAAGGAGHAWQPRSAGRTIQGLGRRGKYLLLGLDGGQTLVMHLRMTGNLVLVEGEGEARSIRGAPAV